jgi:hypothetical protein
MTDPSPTAAIDHALGQLRADLYIAARTRVRRRRANRLAAVSLVLATLGVGGAFAATKWIGQDFTPADLARQYTVVTNDRWAECGTDGCVTKTGTHKQVQILPSMGVSFVLPSGLPVSIIPAVGMGPLPTYLDEERARYGLRGIDRATGRFMAGSIHHTRTGGEWQLDLPDGTSRTIAWQRATGSLTVTDRKPDGSTETAELHAGDVVPLVPDTIDPHARTLEKAVIFDLPSGSRVHIFPTFNETYVGALPPPARDTTGAFGTIQPPPPFRQTLPRAEAERYGLTPTGELEAKLPVTEDGGEWRTDLGNGLERTITWDAGDTHLTISDRRGDGKTREQRVPIGHELPLVPFR